MTIDIADIETSGETLQCPTCQKYVAVLLVRAGRARCRRCVRTAGQEGAE